jgi:hypothetical protein
VFWPKSSSAGSSSSRRQSLHFCCISEECTVAVGPGACQGWCTQQLYVCCCLLHLAAGRHSAHALVSRRVELLRIIVRVQEERLGACHLIVVKQDSLLPRLYQLPATDLFCNRHTYVTCYIVPRSGQHIPDASGFSKAVSASGTVWWHMSG